MKEEKCEHLPYSPNLDSLDYHLWNFLQNHLNGEKSDSMEVKNHFKPFFEKKILNVYKNGIQKFVNGWETVLWNLGKDTAV